jgi:polar amino acid transport system permease protein
VSTAVEPYRPSEIQLGRVAYRRRQTVRSIALAAGSTVVLGVLLVVAVTGSPGWQAVKQSFLDGTVARESFLPILEALWVNVQLLFICAIGALLLGLGIATLRTLRGPIFFPLRALAVLYTYIFRGGPLLIVLYVLAFGVPGLRLTGTPSAFVLAAIGLILTYTSYMAEVFRAGIESVHPSQRAASRSLGLTYRQTMRYVVLPQAVRRVAPALLNDLVSLQKDVGLVSVAGVIDAFRRAQILKSETFNFTPYLVAGALFVLLAIPTILITEIITTRAARRQSAESTT